MAFEKLDISITGSSADAQSSLQAVKTKLQGVERSANATQDSVEELGDSTTSLATKLSGLSATAGATSASLLGLSSVATGSSASLTALGASAATATTLLVGLSAVATPLIATFGAAAAAAGGLATAFGAIVGSGLLAFGEKRGEQNEERLEETRDRIERLELLREQTGELTDAQQDELEQLEETEAQLEDKTGAVGGLSTAFGELQDEIAPLISDLGQQFVPLIEDAFDAIPKLVENIIDALGPLDQFREALRDLGQFAFNAIPDLVQAFVDLGRKALPVIRDLASSVRDTTDGALKALVDVAEQVGDEFVTLAGAIADVIPELVETGVILTEALTPAVESALGGLEDLLAAFNDLARDEDVQQTFADISAAAAEARDVLVDTAERAKEAFEQQFGPIEDIIADVEDRFDRLADAIETAINGDIEGALQQFSDLTNDTVRDIRVALVGESGNSGLVINGIRDLGDWLNTNGAAAIETGMDTIADRGISSIKQLRIALVGESGNGGILNEIIDQSGEFLSTEGARVYKAGFRDIKRVSIAVMDNLKIALVGEDGSGGVLGNIIDEYATFLEEQGPQIARFAFKQVGKAIRGVAIELFNAVTGNDDSILRNIISDFATYLRTDAPGDLRRAAEIAFDIIVAAAEGLYVGLLGGEESSGTLKQIFIDFGIFLKNGAKERIRNGIDAVTPEFDRFVRIVKDNVSYLVGTGEGTLYADITNQLRFIETFVSGTGSNIIGSAFQDVADAVTAPLDAIDFEGIEDTLQDLLDAANEVKDTIESITFPDRPQQQEPQPQPQPPAPAPTPPPEPPGNDEPPPSFDPPDPAPPDPPDNDDPPDGGGIIPDPPDPGDIVPDPPDVDVPGPGDIVPGLATGGLVERSGAAIIHEGERVVPEAQVVDRGPAPAKGVMIESLTVNASGRAEGRAAGRALKDELKRFDI